MLQLPLFGGTIEPRVRRTRGARLRAAPRARPPSGGLPPGLEPAYLAQLERALALKPGPLRSQALAELADPAPFNLAADLREEALATSWAAVAWRGRCDQVAE